MKIICIDDDRSFLEKLRTLIIDYSIKKDIEIKIETLEDIPTIIHENVDAFFIDILIGENTIFNYVSLIRQYNTDVPIIFFSNHDSFVFKSVKYNVFDYIRKKNIDLEFNDMMNRLTNYLLSKKASILLKKDGYYKEVHIHKIMYIESFSHTTIIHTENEIYESKKDTKAILGVYLNNFYKIHRSYYINFKYLESFNNENVYLKNGISIPVGKTYKQKINKDYLHYINKELE